MFPNTQTINDDRAKQKRETRGEVVVSDCKERDGDEAAEKEREPVRATEKDEEGWREAGQQRGRKDLHDLRLSGLKGRWPMLCYAAQTGESAAVAMAREIALHLRILVGCRCPMKNQPSRQARWARLEFWRWFLTQSGFNFRSAQSAPISRRISILPLSHHLAVWGWITQSHVTRGP